MSQSTTLCKLLLVLALPLVARAQTKFEPGYVLPLAGDTLRGQVQLRGELRNARTCLFRPAETAPPTDYAPTQLRGYGTANGLAFESCLLPAADSGQAARQLFAQRLAAGPASLYVCRDQAGRTRYFVALGRGRLRELVQRRVQGYVRGTQVVQTFALYRDTLAAALAGCPAVQAQLPELAYRPAALLGIVRGYNACVGGPAAAQPKQARASRPVLSVVAGYQQGTLSFSGTPFLNLAPPLRQQGFTGGLVLAVALPHTRGTLTLRPEARYAHELYEGSYTGPVPTAALPSPQVNTYRLDLRYLHVPVVLRYTLRRLPLVQPYVEAGGLYALLLSHETAFSNAVPPGSPTALAFFQGENAAGSQFGYVLGAGASLPVAAERRLGVLVRYAAGSGPSNYTSISSPIRYFQVLLSLDLTRP